MNYFYCFILSIFKVLYRKDVVQKVEQEFAGNFSVENHVSLIVAATILYLEGNFETALKILNQSSNLEW